MSLIICPECGQKDVSDSAYSCPKCGFAIREYFQNQSNAKARDEEKIKQEEARKSMEAKIAKYHEEQKRIEQENLTQKKDESEYKYVFMCPQCKKKILYDVKNPYACMCTKCLCKMVYVGDIYSVNSQADATISKNIKNDTNTPKCPTCQSTNINKVSGTSKAVSVAMWGLLSQKVKKQFHCNNCGYEW